MWNTLVINPLSSILEFFLQYTGDIGLAIICFTVVVKLALFYFNLASSRTSKNLKVIQPELEKIRKEHKNDFRAQGEAMSKLYKENKISPFAGIIGLLIQIPILFGLYMIIFKELKMEGIDKITYFNIDITQASFFLAILTLISMFFLMQISSKDMAQAPTGNSQLQQDFVRILAIQMKYVLPVIVFISSLFLPAGITLYFVVSNIFGIGQTLLIRKILK